VGLIVPYGTLGSERVKPIGRCWDEVNVAEFFVYCREKSFALVCFKQNKLVKSAWLLSKALVIQKKIILFSFETS